MSFTDVVNKTGELILSTFGILKDLKNIPNEIFIGILGALFLWWVLKMVKFNKEAEQAGTMK